MMPLEQTFTSAMLDIYRRAKSEAHYNAPWFLQMIADYGGVGAARRLLVSAEVQTGFTALWERGRLDLTVEYHVLKPKFASLFTEEERNEAKKRLQLHGMKI
jgi:hypothetical protein